MSQTAEADVGADERSTLIEIEDLKTYYDGQGVLSSNPVKAVDGVTFDIKRGETLGLVGESGCGKTTLGRTLLRLERATAGTVRYDGTDITALSGAALKRWRRNAQIVFQDPESSLNSRMTVGQIIQDPLNVHDWKAPADRRRRARELLETVGLQPEHYYRYAHQFSGGQLQRIGIARALALNPDFIVLDEPVSALDVSVQAKILNLLADLQEEFGLTYLLIAHDLSVVRHICDRVAVMYLGNIMELGPTEVLFDEPANPYTKSLLSAIPEPDPTKSGDRVILRGTPPSPRNPPAGCPFVTRCPVKIRPEEYADVRESVWERIDVLLLILRERRQTSKSLTEIVKDLFGRETRFRDMEAVIETVFEDVSPPPEIEQQIQRTRQLAAAEEFGAAVDNLLVEFGSVCDAEHPEEHGVGETDRFSVCHRHQAEYEDPETLFDALD